jgi:ComF family protein
VLARRTASARVGSAALDLLFPRFCLGCRARLAPGPAPLLLCVRCRARLEPIDPRAACRGCLRPLPSGLGSRPACGACRRRPPPFERALALWCFRPPLDEVVRAFKFRGLDFLGAELARAAIDAGILAELTDLDLVAPVPLPWPRRLVRGYNQAERLARPFARALGLPLVELLGRRPLAPRQAALARSERSAQAARSLRIRPGPDLAGRRILLVDDVLTTGATVAASAALLAAHGAAGVVVLVAAWTPPEPPPELP